MVLHTLAQHAQSEKQRIYTSNIYVHGKIKQCEINSRYIKEGWELGAAVYNFG